MLLVEQNDLQTELLVDEVLLATGRRPNIEGLDLDRVGVETSPSGVSVDAQLRTSVPDMYACGDVTGRYLFNHVAEYQGSIVAHNLACPDQPRTADYRVVPWATFTDPEVAHVGMTELEARAAGYEVSVEKFPLAGSDRAVTIRKTAGLIKVIAETNSGQILGAHIVGPSAGHDSRVCPGHEGTRAHYRDSGDDPRLPYAFGGAALGRGPVRVPGQRVIRTRRVALEREKTHLRQGPYVVLASTSVAGDAEKRRSRYRPLTDVEMPSGRSSRSRPVFSSRTRRTGTDPCAATPQAWGKTRSLLHVPGVDGEVLPPKYRVDVQAWACHP